MSGPLNSRDDVTIRTNEQVLAFVEEKLADISAKNRREQSEAARQIGEETRAIQAGVKHAAGKRIQRVPQSYSEIYALVGLRGTLAAAFWPIIQAVHDSLDLNNLRQFISWQPEVNTRVNHKVNVCDYNDPNLIFEFTEIEVPESVKAKLESEIAQVERAETALAQRYEGGMYGPFAEERDLYNLKRRYLLYKNPHTEQYAHVADRVEALAERERLLNPNAPQVICTANVCYVSRPCENGGLKQRVHISHSLDDMDGETVTTPQMIHKIQAAQPVPSGP